jgi:predicted NUDIX family NTP pyrophosphohydrolase
MATPVRKKKTFPEVDKAAWFDVEEAKVKINSAQSAFIDKLSAQL